MSITDYLPANRREIIILFCGAAVAFGATRVPGVTIEPAELTECRTALTTCEAHSERHASEVAKLEERIQRCWALQGRASEPKGLAEGVTPVPDWTPWFTSEPELPVPAEAAPTVP